MQGANCCSPEVISFHYVSPAEMHVLDYLVHTARMGNVETDSGVGDEERVKENRKAMEAAAARELRKKMERLP